MYRYYSSQFSAYRSIRWLFAPCKLNVVPMSVGWNSVFIDFSLSALYGETPFNGFARGQLMFPLIGWSKVQEDEKIFILDHELKKKSPYYPVNGSPTIKWKLSLFSIPWVINLVFCFFRLQTSAYVRLLLWGVFPISRPNHFSQEKSLPMDLRLPSL